ncbi:MAG: hypothetical protein AAF518_26800 [Spirochaetota bacterium]
MARKTEPFIISRANLHPKAPFVKQQLITCYQTIASTRYNPAGGERFGTCTVACLKDDKYTLEEALLALWKISLCNREEFPYEVWHTTQATSILKYDYQEQYDSWTKLEQSRDFNNWLTTQAQKCIQATYNLTKPLNLPSFLSDTCKIQTSKISKEWQQKLEDFAFAQPGSLQATLANAWNDSEGLFYSNQHWYLLSWGTSA